MPEFLRNSGRGDIRGRPAGRLSLFLGCARGATGEDFALCGGRPKALPLESAILLKKAGPKTFFLSGCSGHPYWDGRNRLCAKVSYFPAGLDSSKVRLPEYFWPLRTMMISTVSPTLQFWTALVRSSPLLISAPLKETMRSPERNPVD